MTNSNMLRKKVKTIKLIKNAANVHLKFYTDHERCGFRESYSCIFSFLSFFLNMK